MKNMKQTILEYVKVILVTVILTYGFLFFVQISHVEGQYMEPNYNEGNIVLVNKQFYHYDDVKYGDVIIAKCNILLQQRQIIKRVIGKQGDTIECIDHELYRNGKKVNETYINEQMTDSNWTYTVPKGDVFIMGDNRNHSTDSRYIGAVSFKKEIVGKVFFKAF